MTVTSDCIQFQTKLFKDLKVFQGHELWILSHQHVISYLFLNLNVEFVFYHVHQRVFAAGIEHPLSDAALVTGHGINEDCTERGEQRRQ